MGRENIPLKLNIGCGRIHKEEYYNVDITDFDGVDKCMDMDSIPWDLPTNHFEYILMDNVLEHLDDITAIMDEIHRIAKPGCQIKIIVPYYNSEGAYNDLTHKHFFTKHSLEPYYAENTRSNYFSSPKFKLVKMNFMPTRLGRLLISKNVQLIASYIFCQVLHQIHYTLEVIK